MAQKDRVFQILDLIRAKQKVNVSELSEKFQVTGETIRRDLERLEREGYVARTYGGAVLIQQPPGHVNYTERAIQNVEAKNRMTHKSAAKSFGSSVMPLRLRLTQASVVSANMNIAAHAALNRIPMVSSLQNTSLMPRQMDCCIGCRLLSFVIGRP